MRVLVTGASGNVGTAVLRRLAEESDVDVVGLARRPPPPSAAPYDTAEWIQADVNEDDLVPHLQGVDAVVHLAWLIQPSHRPQEMHRVNVGGTRHLLDAISRAGVGTLVHASSVGAYAPRVSLDPVDESYPTTGIASSIYSRHKAQAERLLDGLETQEGSPRVVRVRPGVVLSRRASSEQARYFLGPFVPTSVVRPELLPVLPLPRGLAIQVVDADDLADAIVRALRSDLHGGLNVATDPPLEPASLGAALGAHVVTVPREPIRALVDATWRLRLQPTDVGWVDLGTRSPLMSTERARSELGWTPTVDATTALLSVLEALRRGEGTGSPVLAPLTALPARALAALRGGVPGH